MNRRCVVTLLSDFGTADSYVAEMKGRLLGLAPDLTIVDVTHDIPPGDVTAAAFVLGRAWRAFPDGTVHLAVVDPGVGTARRALVVEAGRHRFTGPDNGILDAALSVAGSQVFALPVPAGGPSSFWASALVETPRLSSVSRRFTSVNAPVVSFVVAHPAASVTATKADKKSKWQVKYRMIIFDPPRSRVVSRLRETSPAPDPALHKPWIV